MISGRSKPPPLYLVIHFNRLQWNQSEFGNVSVIRLDPRKIWIPDIEVYNAAVKKLI